MVLQKFPSMFLDMSTDRENSRAWRIVKKSSAKRTSSFESVGEGRYRESTHPLYLSTLVSRYLIHSILSVMNVSQLRPTPRTLEVGTVSHFHYFI